jgi:sugar lactone lactonase YvrE
MHPRSFTRLTRPFVSLVAAGLVGCGGSPTAGGGSGPAPAVLRWAVDIDNESNAGDISVRFEPPAAAGGIAEFRVHLLDDGDAASFDLAAAASAPSTSFVSVPVRNEPVDVTFPGDATTTSGALPENGGSYAVVVESVASEAGVPSALSSFVTVRLAHTNIVRTLVDRLSGGTGGMDVDGEGNIYVGDFGTSLDGPPGTVVFRISPDGEVETWARGLVGASGNAFDSDGNLYQSNIGAGRISRITPDGTVSTFATGLDGGPVGIAVTAGDTLYVVNCGRNRIHKIGPDGVGSVWVADPLLSCPNGITLADDGNLYVSNWNNGDVLRVTPEGTVSRHASIGSNNGHILFGNGRLYLVARGSHRIYEVTLDGDVTLLAGSGARGKRDGAARTAQLSFTNDVALSPDGSVLYFNDVDTGATGDRIIGPMVVRMILLEEEGSR